MPLETLTKEVYTGYNEDRITPSRTITIEQFPGYTQYTNDPVRNSNQFLRVSYVYIELPPQRQLITWSGHRRSTSYSHKFFLPLPWTYFRLCYSLSYDNHQRYTRPDDVSFLFSSDKVKDIFEPHPVIPGPLPNVSDGSGGLCLGPDSDRIGTHPERAVDVFYGTRFNRDMYDCLIYHKLWQRLAKESNHSKHHIVKVFQYWESLSLKQICAYTEDIETSHIYNPIQISHGSLPLEQ